MEVVCFSSHSIGPTNQQRSARARTQQQQNGRSERRGLPVETFARSISGRKLVRLLGRTHAWPRARGGQGWKTRRGAYAAKLEMDDDEEEEADVTWRDATRAASGDGDVCVGARSSCEGRDALSSRLVLRGLSSACPYLLSVRLHPVHGGPVRDIRSLRW